MNTPALALYFGAPSFGAHNMRMTGFVIRFLFLMFGRSQRNNISLPTFPFCRHFPRKTPEPLKCGVVVITQPYRAERYRNRVACNRTKRHLRKLGSNGRLGGEAHTPAHCNKMHQGLMADIEPLHANGGPKFCELLDQLVVHGTPQLRMTQNDLLVTEGRPCDLVMAAEGMPLWHRHIDVFGPKSGYFAIGQVWGPQNKGNVQLARANERYLFGRCALPDVHQHAGLAFMIGPHDFAKEAGGHRR